jgi:hypothetical protein
MGPKDEAQKIYETYREADGNFIDTADLTLRLDARNHQGRRLFSFPLNGNAPIGPQQVGPTTARWGKEISSVFHEGFCVGRLFRAIVHCRHFSDVFVPGTADQPGCG